LIVLCSEMQLCNALLRWYENQTEELQSAELTRHLCEGYTSILKKIQLSLLPIEFILGEPSLHHVVFVVPSICNC
jgi:hypothetical protein